MINTPRNTSYFFIPFSFGKQKDFSTFIGLLDNSQMWSLVHDEIMYMLKYVADKLDSNDRKNCQCFHYELNDEAFGQNQLGKKNTWYSTSTHEYRGEVQEFQFQIISIQLYCFSTSVCIMVLRIQLEKSDPIWISTAQYYLKKVAREKISRKDEKGIKFTFLDLTKTLMQDLHYSGLIEYFYYANPSTERANVLTYIEVEPKDDFKYELFYLRRCYSEGFLYAENPKLDADETYIPSEDTIWGISPEAAVCLACPGLGRADFICNTFYKNFNAQYLFMYVLLLHQKYVLYMFLTRIGVGIYNDLEMLEEYRKELYEFETDFVFSCVTEVPQYQNLYDRMTYAFSLKKMYEDVHEPLLSLSEIRRETYENQQKKRDDTVNKALLVLSVLSFFSALVDSFDFVESFFGWFVNSTGVRIIQILCIALIGIVVIYVFIALIKSNKNQ